MEIKPHLLPGVFEITLMPREDSRGFFMRTFDISIFRDAGLERNWVQDNHAYSKNSNVIRGLHFQLPPHSETKLVRCICGEVLDVFVDIRLGSPTFGKWGSVVLSATKKNMIFIPRGFAHGYKTLTDDSEVLYRVDSFYNKEAERGLLYSDPAIGIDWNAIEPELSDKDKQNLLLSEFVRDYKGIDLSLMEN